MRVHGFFKVYVGPRDDVLVSLCLWIMLCGLIQSVKSLAERRLYEHRTGELVANWRHGGCSSE